MNIDKLTPNGVEKMINQIPAVLQIIQLAKTKDSKLFKCTISDGFCKVKTCLIMIPQGKSLYKQFDVIQVIKINKAAKGNISVYIIQQSSLVHTGIEKIIGKPMPEQEYNKNNKKNPQGSNLIQLPKSTSINKGIPEKQISKEIKKVIQPEKQQPQKKVQKKVQKKIPNNVKQESRQSKAFSKKSHLPYIPIKQLYFGIEDWKILCRVLVVFPVRLISTKKGQQTEVLNVLVGDKSGEITCVMFGPVANKFQTVFQPDQAIQIEGASVSQNQYMGKKQLKINFNERTSVSVKQSDQNVPYIQDFCLTVRQMVELPEGSECNVVCLVKGSNQLNEFTSKTGRDMKKKTITLCDPQQKVQADLILWNQKSQMTFQKFPYAFFGIKISSYKGNKQYGYSSMGFYARPLKHHVYRKYIRQLSQIDFKNLSPNSTSKEPDAYNFHDLLRKGDKISDQQILWTVQICYVNNIKGSGKATYMGCPFCKKKVVDEQNSICNGCGKNYQRAKHRYILNVNLSDGHESIWCSCYDEVAEKILSENQVPYPANAFVLLSEEQIKERLRVAKYKPWKLKISSKLDQYNGQKRLKHQIINLIPLDYVEQSRILIKKLKESLIK